MRDSWIVRVLVSVIVGAAAYAIDAWLSKGGASVLTAVIVAATLAYCWFTYDLVTTARSERDGRLAALRTEERRLVERLIVEIQQNLHRKGQTHAWYAHVPFEMTAFDDARHLFLRMPPEVWSHVAEISSRSARYNVVAHYANERIAPGSGSADGFVTRLAVEAHETQENAIPILQKWAKETFDDE